MEKHNLSHIPQRLSYPSSKFIRFILDFPREYVIAISATATLIAKNSAHFDCLEQASFYFNVQAF